MAQSVAERSFSVTAKKERIFGRHGKTDKTDHIIWFLQQQKQRNPLTPRGVMPRGERGMCNKSRRRKKNKKEGECGKSRAAAKINGKINKSILASAVKQCHSERSRRIFLV